ncbi:hypothetical protein V2S66_18295 [Streptomyces sp. V4-01]|uniref:Uncharacterized protein n=1 Tax=Actinacidiphila polyblastidii TaxID=3110430 RepID=A0ABU7PDQ4_9ACTN|nr:hypothetical protein [Streptomyces sp. V4-01]
MSGETTGGAPDTADRLFCTARAVADAMLFEGYVLYPYRASAAKNRMRWQFGVLVPPSWDGHRGEHSAQRTECLMEPRSGAALHARLRFLRAQRRTVQRLREDGGHEDAEALELPDRVLVPWDEGVEEQADLTATIGDLTREGGVTLPLRLDAGEDVEDVRDASGAVVGRLVRRRARVEARMRLTATELPGPFRVLRLTAVVENTGPWTAADAPGTTRDDVLPHALVSAHLMLGLTAGSFVSMTDPPQWAAEAVARCRNDHTWPVLAGADGRSDAVLSSPIILEDHPQIAPESPGALYDATEIDEILALRTAALTDQEKREARGTDERAGAVIDLADSMPPEVLERLHGAVRSLRALTGHRPGEGPPTFTTPGPATPVSVAPDGPGAGEAPAWQDPADALMRPDAPWWDPAADRSVDPGRDRVPVGGRTVGAGDRVTLRPGLRRTDAQDMFLDGRAALVEAVLHDVDGSVHLAVTVEGDPGAELQRAQGRFRYFQPDEVALPEDEA